MDFKELRKGLDGIYRISDDTGYTWTYFKVLKDGSRAEIEENEYTLLKGSSKEVETATAYANLVSFRVTFI